MQISLLFYIFARMEGKVMSRFYLTVASLLAAAMSFFSCTKAYVPDSVARPGVSTETRSELPSEAHAPVVTSAVESMYFEGTGATFTIAMDEHFSDPDGDVLSYSVSMNTKGLVDLKIEGSTLNGKLYNYGRTDIVITATDGDGLSADLPFAVLCAKKDSGASVYPNPVRPNGEGRYLLNVCSGREAETDIRIYNQSGSLAWSNTLLSSVFKPAVVDMTDFASGKYNVVVRINGETYTHSIIKL